MSFRTVGNTKRKPATARRAAKQVSIYHLTGGDPELCKTLYDPVPRIRVVAPPPELYTPKTKMRWSLDLRGQWGLLNALRGYAPTDRAALGTHWHCVCRCGAQVMVIASKLTQGAVFACSWACWNRHVEAVMELDGVPRETAVLSLLALTRTRIRRFLIGQLGGIDPHDHKRILTTTRLVKGTERVAQGIMRAWARLDERECHVELTRRFLPDGVEAKWVARVTRATDGKTKAVSANTAIGALHRLARAVKRDRIT